MIPKIIHYCWFGRGVYPESVQKCIDSWKKYCPDYEIIEWNESNFDVNYNDFTKEAYAAKKYAFVSDVARLCALIEYGGVYMDTDMELVKPIDSFLCYDCVSGFFENAECVATAFLASVKEAPILKKFLQLYDNRHFINPDGSLNMNPNNNLFTEMCVQLGLRKENVKQTVYGLTVFPSEYFSPKNSITKKITITDNTYGIHHFEGSWYSDIKDYKQQLRAKYPFLPEKAVSFVAYMKLRGVHSAVRAVRKWLREKRKSA